MKAFETKLPDGYVEVKTIDVKNKKIAIAFNLIAASTIIITIVTAWFSMFGTQPFAMCIDKLRSDNLWHDMLRLIFFAVVSVIYIVLHELTHGLVYKLFTKQKLSFGLTLTAAYCGVPDIYIYRTVALLSLLAPFCVFLPVFLIPIFFLPYYADKLIFSFLLGMHVGGCVGDLYDACLYLFKLRDPATLMRDTGPKQTFYRYVEETNVDKSV